MSNVLVIMTYYFFVFLLETASPAKRLHGGVKFIDAIPKNATGKILRRILRDLITKKPISKL